jgi:hypothetical protein
MIMMYSSSHWADEVKPSSIAEANESLSAPTAPVDNPTNLLPLGETKEIA